MICCWMSILTLYRTTHLCLFGKEGVSKERKLMKKVYLDESGNTGGIAEKMENLILGNKIILYMVELLQMNQRNLFY